MMFNRFILTIFYVTPLVMGWIDFTLDYYIARRVGFVCLLSCENDAGSHHNFAKQASKRNVAVSSCDIDGNFRKNTKNLDMCMKKIEASAGVLINTRCPEFGEVVYHASENMLFDTKHKWVFIEQQKTHTNNTIFRNGTVNFNEILYDTSSDNKNKVAPTIAILNNLNLSVDADITLSVKIDDSSYSLYEVYNFGKARNGKFVIKSIGEWDIEKGLNISEEYKFYRRWDFQQLAFKMAVVINPLPEVFDPQMILGATPDQRVATITLSSTMILNEITGIHNFRYDYTVFDIWVGDYIKEHKAVTNAIYFKEQDITPVLRFLPEHFDRYEVVAPAVTFIETRFYYRIPSGGVGKFENQFLRPLSPGTWWCVVGVCALCCIVLLLCAFVENRPINIYHWCYAIFSVLALICQQFFEEFEDIRRISAGILTMLTFLTFPVSPTQKRKLTILVTGLACLLLYNYYTSSVVSWLLNGPPPSINSLWELLDSPLQPVFEDTGYTYSWLQLPDYYFNSKKAKAEDVLKKRLNNMMKKGKTVVASLDEGIDLVRKGGYAYHAETNAANARISRTFNQPELCDLDSLYSMEKFLLYPSVQKNSPYREFFSWSLARLQERGIIQCMHKRTWPHEVKCEGSSPRALALGGAAPAFIVLAAGFIIGTVIMLTERLCWNYFNNKKPTTKTRKLKNYCNSP